MKKNYMHWAAEQSFPLLQITTGLQNTYFVDKTFGTGVGILHGKPHSEQCHELDSINLDPDIVTTGCLS